MNLQKVIDVVLRQGMYEHDTTTAVDTWWCEHEMKCITDVLRNRPGQHIARRRQERVSGADSWTLVLRAPHPRPGPRPHRLLDHQRLADSSTEKKTASTGPLLSERPRDASRPNPCWQLWLPLTPHAIETAGGCETVVHLIRRWLG